MTQWKLMMIAVLAITTLAVADDQEKKIKRADLPAAVAKTVAAISQGAIIKGFSQEVENGQTLSTALARTSTSIAAAPSSRWKSRSRWIPFLRL